jgi:hypothetical protein
MQHRLTDFGEKLAAESDPVIAAVGKMLMEVADQLDAVDRVYSGDREQDQLAAPIAALRALLPQNAPANVALHRALAAFDVLRAELEPFDRPS